MRAVGASLLHAATCAEAPSIAIRTAEQALDDAREAAAATYAVNEWNLAREAMSAARAEIAVQEARLPLRRSYRRAVEMMVNAENLAHTAERAALAGREKVRLEAETALSRVRADLDTAATLLGEFEECTSFPTTRGWSLQLLKGNLQGLRDSVRAIEAVLAGGRYSEANTLAISLQTVVADFVTDLGDARSGVDGAPA